MVTVSEPPGHLALTAAYRENYARLVRIAYSITGRRDDAEELVQESFITAQQRWGTVREYDDPPAWLRHVVVNRCLSFQRRSGSQARAVALLESHNATPPPDVTLSDHDDTLWTAVRGLPKMQAAVIGLMFIDDQSAAQTAALLGCSEDTVRTHLRRAKVALAARLLASSPASTDLKDNT